MIFDVLHECNKRIEYIQTQSFSRMSAMLKVHCPQNCHCGGPVIANCNLAGPTAGALAGGFMNVVARLSIGVQI
jgi:hypothetical protein